MTFLLVKKDGKVDLAKFREELCDETILVSTMAVNNEIGTIEPVEEIATIIKAYNDEHGKEIVYHVDAIQAFGKRILYPKRIGIHAMSISGHKIHGPKGSGALFVDSKVKIVPILFGGGQEKGLRSGTENTAAIAGLAKATEEMYFNLDENLFKMHTVKDAFIV